MEQILQRCEEYEQERSERTDDLQEAEARVAQLEQLLGVNQRGWDTALARVAELEEALKALRTAAQDREKPRVSSRGWIQAPLVIEACESALAASYDARTLAHPEGED